MAETDELFAQGAAKLSGADGVRDTAAARELFRRSGGLGRPDAAIVFANLLASGVGGPRDWPGALRLLASLSEVSARCRRELEIVSAMALDAEGDPAAVPEGEIVCEAPRITLFRALLTPAECRYLADAAGPMLAPAVVVDKASGRQVRDPVRSAEGAGFPWPLENPAVHALNRRFAAVSGTVPQQGEPLQVLRYRPGEDYKPHLDAIPGFSNQRAMTLLVWLNAGFEGGETAFPAAKRKLRGGVGDAILFRNIRADGRPDPASAHAGLAVSSGEKWLASRWIRERPYEPPVGPRAA
jgi:prolyl 4-hydroxylase